MLGRTATAVLMGLALAGCPADDDSGDSMGGDGSSSSSATTAGSSGPGETTVGDSSTVTGSTAVTFDESGAQSAYGSPDTETFGTTDMTESDTTSSGGDTDTDTDTDTDADTDPGTTTAAPLYGAAE